MTEQTHQTRAADGAAAASPAKRRGRPWLIAAGFLFAFALTIVTVVLTGLFVRAPRSAGDDPAAFQRPAAVRPGEEMPAPSRRTPQ